MQCCVERRYRVLACVMKGACSDDGVADSTAALSLAVAAG
jgi:hypothetical protein